MQGEAWDYPESFFVCRVSSDRRSASAAQLMDAVAAIKASRKLLDYLRRRVKYAGAGKLCSASRNVLRHSVRRNSGRERDGGLLPSAERRRRRRNRLPGRQPAGERSRFGYRHRGTRLAISPPHQNGCSSTPACASNVNVSNFDARKLDGIPPLADAREALTSLDSALAGEGWQANWARRLTASRAAS